jgi:hypothetical protein
MAPGTRTNSSWSQSRTSSVARCPEDSGEIGLMTTSGDAHHVVAGASALSWFIERGKEVRLRAQSLMRPASPSSWRVWTSRNARDVYLTNRNLARG